MYVKLPVMITVYHLKSRFQNMLRPLCAWLFDHGVTANQVTLSAVGLSVFYGALLCFDFWILWLLLPLILFVRMGLNAIDGMLAREHNMKSKLGMALNELGDVISDIALFIPFFFLAPQAVWAVLFFILAAIMTEMCGLVSYMMNGERRYDGPMGKSDRAVMVGILGFLIGWGFVGAGLIPWVFVICGALAIWSCVNRIRGGLVETSQENYDV